MAEQKRERMGIAMGRDLFLWVRHRALDEHKSASDYVCEVLREHRSDVEGEEFARESAESDRAEVGRAEARA